MGQANGDSFGNFSDEFGEGSEAGEKRSRRSVSFHRSTDHSHTSDGWEEDDGFEDDAFDDDHGADDGEDGGVMERAANSERQGASLLKGVAKKVKNLQHLKRMSSGQCINKVAPMISSLSVEYCQSIDVQVWSPKSFRSCWAHLGRGYSRNQVPSIPPTLIRWSWYKRSIAVGSRRR